MKVPPAEVCRLPRHKARRTATKHCEQNILMARAEPRLAVGHLARTTSAHGASHQG